MSESGIPQGWRRAALAPPRAFGAPSARALLKAGPGDFRVEERLSFTPDGGQAHRLLRVEKADANTLFVARVLARAAGLRPHDVGFAGLKDRRAVAIQWFSLPAGRDTEGLAGFEGPGFRVLEVQPHSRKLRRGALSGNRFRIVLRELTGDLDEVQRRLAAIEARGVPNYFGPQRFGREAANLDAVHAWLADGRLPGGREERAFVLSAARSLAFNAVLAARVEAGSWDRLLPGEVVNLDGSGSVFVASGIDADLERRAAEFDVHPTGPLPGSGGVRPDGEAGLAESAALSPLAALTAALDQAGAEAARRPLRVRPASLQSAIEDGCLVLDFDLPRGAFATTLLAEVVSCELDAAGDDGSG
ncbi:MAG: tRNA pseudouridine(13) synthase TruD [Steroidobacteraceae bacterium]|nr:tRNA pseudouridine(13) synthase TruD [Steroidobacteraceae bacterium]